MRGSATYLSTVFVYQFRANTSLGQYPCIVSHLRPMLIRLLDFRCPGVSVVILLDVHSLHLLLNLHHKEDPEVLELLQHSLRCSLVETLTILNHALVRDSCRHRTESEFDDFDIRLERLRVLPPECWCSFLTRYVPCNAHRLLPTGASSIPDGWRSMSI